jgi:hypothetical protein
MRIMATFIGKDGSCGYSTSATYVLIIGVTTNWNIYITRPDGSGYCEYSTVLTFLHNWSNINTLS